MPIKLAFSNSLCPELDFAALIENSRAWGYDGFEFCLTGGEASLPRHVPTLQRRLRAADQTLICLHAGTLPRLIHPHALGAALQRAVQSIALAAEIGSHFVTISGCPVAAGTPKVRAAEQSTLALKELANEGIRHRVTVLLENAGAFSSSQDAWFLHDAAASPALRVCLNLMNARAAGDPPSLAIPRLAAATSLLRLGDAQFGPDDQVMQYVTCGAGQLDVPRVIELLRGFAYEGWLSAHWPPAARDDLPRAEELLPAVAKYLRAKLTKPTLALTAYKGDNTAPRFAARPTAPASTRKS